jgi:hypothetical protein
VTNTWTIISNIIFSCLHLISFISHIISSILSHFWVHRLYMIWLSLMLFISWSVIICNITWVRTSRQMCCWNPATWTQENKITSSLCFNQLGFNIYKHNINLNRIMIKTYNVNSRIQVGHKKTNFVWQEFLSHKKFNPKCDIPLDHYSMPSLGSDFNPMLLLAQHFQSIPR